MNLRLEIDGVIFDTTTATKLHEINVGKPGDEDYEHTALYRGSKEIYFLVGEGGKLSRWSCSGKGGELRGDAGISVLASDEACDWADWHGMDTAEIENEFGFATVR
ncbi:MAG TPA: hypothetical protein VGK27_06725 [Candidatus Deferrimicrobiaceae bacterium]|jgi:hypothetical protein